MVQIGKLKMGKGAIISCLSKYIHPSLWVRNYHGNTLRNDSAAKGAQENQR